MSDFWKVPRSEFGKRNVYLSRDSFFLTKKFFIILNYSIRKSDSKRGRIKSIVTILNETFTVDPGIYTLGLRKD